LLREPDDMLELDGRDAPLAPPKLPWPPPRAPVLALPRLAAFAPPLRFAPVPLPLRLPP